MLNKKMLFIALALVLGAASNAVAATKKPVGIHQRAALSAYASVAMNRGGQRAWFDQAKGNIDGF